MADWPESDFVTALVTDPCDVEKLIVHTGFYKEHTTPAGKKQARVYLNHALTDYYEYEDPDENIKLVKEIDDDDRHRVWIKHGAPARIVRTRAINVEQGPLLDGPIVRALLPAPPPPPVQPWPAQYAPYHYGFPQAGVEWAGLDDDYTAPSSCSRCGSAGSP